MNHPIKRTLGASRGPMILFAFLFCAAAVFATVVTPAVANAGNDVTIVSVDVKKIVEAHPAFAEARTKMQEAVDQKRKELEAMEEGDRRMAQQEMQQELQQQNQDLQDAAFEKIRRDIQKVAAEKGV